MTAAHEERNRRYYAAMWQTGLDVYESHPTSRHRRRFILDSVKAEPLKDGSVVFDYGCGPGTALGLIRDILGLEDAQLGGCDISPEAILRARERLPGASFREGAFPEVEKLPSIIICTEVIEHTPEYLRILEWIHLHLADGGLLVLTTPSEPMDPPDVVYGHTQHFDLRRLVYTLEKLGFVVEHAKRWGFPFFTLQKLLTRCFYGTIEKRIIGGGMTPAKRMAFDVLYRLYFLHDYVNHGPQIFIRARKPANR